MFKQKSLEKKDENMNRNEEKNSSHKIFWGAVGGATLLGVAALLIANLDDLKRYIKMVRM